MSKPYVFSASQLEYYRRYANDPDKLIDLLLFGIPDSESMTIGRAFHRLMERWADNPPGTCLDVHAMGGYRFVFPRAVKFKFDVPDSYERRLFKDVVTDEIVISGRYDALIDDTVIDYKTTRKPIVLGYYPDSMQWKTYCWLADVPYFEYQVIRLREMNRVAPQPSDQPLRFFAVIDQRRLNLQAYDNMAIEVKTAAHNLHSFCVVQGIGPDQVFHSDPSLPQYFDAPARHEALAKSAENESETLLQT